MRQSCVLGFLVVALSFVLNVAGQSPLMRGCATGSNIPYPTPVVYGTSVDLPATSYLNSMSCSFILNLQSPSAFDSTLTFSKFQTELNYDFIEVYNGCDPMLPLQRNSSIAPPCSLISDFPFQIMRKSGIFRSVAKLLSWRAQRCNTKFILQFPSRGLRRALHPRILDFIGLGSLPYRWLRRVDWLRCYAGPQELGRVWPFP
jgi:hypothetical protein